MICNVLIIVRMETLRGLNLERSTSVLSYFAFLSGVSNDGLHAMVVVFGDLW